jgi:hypothetical protein
VRLLLSGGLRQGLAGGRFCGMNWIGAVAGAVPPRFRQGKTGRVVLPLIARDAIPTVLVDNGDIADAFDAERYGAE